MDKDFSPAPLDDQDLEALFAAVQRDTPELDPEFLAQLQAQAARGLASTTSCGAPATAAPGYLGGCHKLSRKLAAGRPGRAWPWLGRRGSSSESARRRQCWTSPALISRPRVSASFLVLGLRLNSLGKIARG